MVPLRRANPAALSSAVAGSSGASSIPTRRSWWSRAHASGDNSTRVTSTAMRTVPFRARASRPPDSGASERRGGLVSEGRAVQLQPVGLELAVQRRAGDSQGFGGPGPVAAVLLQGLKNGFEFGLLHRAEGPPGRPLADLPGKVVGADVAMSVRGQRSPDR